MSEEPEECPKFVDNEKILCFHGPRKIFTSDIFFKEAHLITSYSFQLYMKQRFKKLEERTNKLSTLFIIMAGIRIGMNGCVYFSPLITINDTYLFYFILFQMHIACRSPRLECWNTHRWTLKKSGNWTMHMRLMLGQLKKLHWNSYK